MYRYPHPKNRTCHEPIVVSPDTHSMDGSLEQYLKIKIHPLIGSAKTQQIAIVGLFDRSAGISACEKTGKSFNYMRPTAVVNQAGITELRCFPGIDYVFHFGNIVKTYAYITGRNIDLSCSIPDEETCWKALERSSLSKIPKSETVVMGYVEGLDYLSHDAAWKGSGNFRFKHITTRSGKALLLGCKHTYWGDIAGRIVVFLSQMGIRRVIYSGKLGTLDPEYEPNKTIATGNKSILPDGKTIEWNNLFGSIVHPTIKNGVHITVPSVLQESKSWVDTNRISVAYVDPEIGHMAFAAQQTGIEFSYLHIVSDNLSRKYAHDLSNERVEEVRRNRTELLRIIGAAILST